MRKYCFFSALISIFLFVCCRGKDRVEANSTPYQASYAEDKNSVLKHNKPSYSSLMSQIDSFALWSKDDKKGSSLVRIDTLPNVDNVFLYLKKDGSQLFNELYRISETSHRICATYKDHFYMEDISVFSYKYNKFVSFFYSVVDEGLRREYTERCITLIARNNKVYEVRLKNSPEVNDIIKKAVSHYDESLAKRFENKDEYGFCLILGDICIRPIPYSAFDDDGGDWIKIPLRNDLEFRLIDTEQIIDEISQLSYN